MLIPKGALEVYRIASKDQSRPNLTRVRAERDQHGTPRLTATDGHRFVTVTWMEPPVEVEPNSFGDLAKRDCFTANLLPEMCVEVGRAIPSGAADVFRHAWLEESNHGNVIRMGAGDRTLGQAVQCEADHDPAVDYPDVRGLLRGRKSTVARIGIDGKYLAEMLKVMLAACGGRGVVLELTGDVLAPLTLIAENLDGTTRAEGMIMPLQIDLTGKLEEQEKSLLEEATAPECDAVA